MFLLTEMSVSEMIKYPFTFKHLITPCKNMQNDMINLSKKQCWCCDTILCKNNWSVGNKITDIVDEFKFLYKIKKRAIERKWAKIISRECLIEDIPISSFL